MSRRVALLPLLLLVLVATDAVATLPKTGIETNATGTVVDANTVDGFDTGVRIGDGAAGQKVLGNTIQNSTLGIQRGGTGGNFIGANKFSTVTTEWSVDGGTDGVVTPAGTWWQQICVEDATRTITTCLTPGSINVNGQVIGITDGNLVVPGTVTAGVSVMSPTFLTSFGVPLPSVGKLQGNSGQVNITLTGQPIRLKGVPPTTVSTTNPLTGTIQKNCSLSTSIDCTVNGDCPSGETCVSNTLWFKTELDFKSALTKKVDKACFPDEPTLCGPENRPCCNFNQALAQVQRENGGNGDNGFVTCSGDSVTGCGRCTLNDAIGCNEDADCYDKCLVWSEQESRCSLTGAVCTTDASCAGTNSGVCAANDASCADSNLGLCNGPLKAYVIDGRTAGGRFDEQIASRMLRPGSLTLLATFGAVQIADCEYTPATGFVCIPFTQVPADADPQGPFTPDQCLIDITNTTYFQINGFVVSSSLGNGICSFGNTHNFQIQSTTPSTLTANGWPYWFTGGGNTTGNFFGANAFPFGTNNQLHWTSRSASCSHNHARACAYDTDCEGLGTCTYGSSGDVGTFGTPFFFQGGTLGGTALDWDSEACGSRFNPFIDIGVFQLSASVTSRPNIGIRMHTSSCEGPYDPAHPSARCAKRVCSNNSALDCTIDGDCTGGGTCTSGDATRKTSFCTTSGDCDASYICQGDFPIRPLLRNSNWMMRLNDAITGPTEYDIAYSIEDYSDFVIRGSLDYNVTKRYVGPNASIIYSEGTEHFGDPWIKQLPEGSTVPAAPQEGEFWRERHGPLHTFTGGQQRQFLYGVQTDTSTGALHFPGDYDDTLKINRTAGTPSIRSIAHGIPGFQYEWLQSTYLYIGLVDVPTEGVAYNPTNRSALQKGTGCAYREYLGGGTILNEWYCPASATYTPTTAPTSTAANTPTITRTVTPTNGSPTITSTATPTITPTFTRTSTKTPTPTYDVAQPTWTPVFTSTPAPTITLTRTVTKTATGTITQTTTATPTATNPPEACVRGRWENDKLRLSKVQVDFLTDQPCGAATAGPVVTPGVLITATDRLGAASISVGGNAINNVPTPAASTDAANKAYVDAAHDAVTDVPPGTAAQILMSNATPVSAWTTMSGDATIGATGVLAIAADSVALGTDTTGSYAAGDAEAGNATGLACTDCVALSTETTGNYLTSISVASPVSCTGCTAAEGGTPALGIVADSIGTTQVDEAAAFTFTALGNITFPLETNRTIQIADSTTASTAGGTLTVKGAAGSNTTTGAGGPVAVTSGAGGSAGGTGGALNLTAGAGTTGAGFGASGGAVNITSGAATVLGNSGSVAIATGTGGVSSGAITATTAAGGSNGDSGGISLTTGVASGGTSANAGDITLTGGTGSATDAGKGGGDVSLIAGAGTTNGIGGDVNLTAGAGAGTGTAGKIMATGHVITLGAAPTVSTACAGETITATSTDTAGRIMVGTSGTCSAATITFAGSAYVNAPFCTADFAVQGGTLTIKTVAPTTTTIVITASGNFAANDEIQYICVGAE